MPGCGRCDRAARHRSHSDHYVRCFLTSSGATGTAERSIMTDNHQQPILEVKDLKKHYRSSKASTGNWWATPRPLTGSAHRAGSNNPGARRGERMRESTTGHCIMRGIGRRPQVIFHDRERGPIDVAQADSNMLRQCASTCRWCSRTPALHEPAHDAVRHRERPLVVNKVAQGKDLKDRVAELCAWSACCPSTCTASRTRFSGGQRQRIASPLSGPPAAIHHRR